MVDYLRLPDDYGTRTSEPGKKRVKQALGCAASCLPVFLFLLCLVGLEYSHACDTGRWIFFLARDLSYHSHPAAAE